MSAQSQTLWMLGSKPVSFFKSFFAVEAAAPIVSFFLFFVSRNGVATSLPFVARGGYQFGVCCCSLRCQHHLRSRLLRLSWQNWH